MINKPVRAAKTLGIHLFMQSQCFSLSLSSISSFSPDSHVLATTNHGLAWVVMTLFHSIYVFLLPPGIQVTYINLRLFSLLTPLTPVRTHQGKFFKCSDGSKRTESECHGTYLIFPEGQTDKPEIQDREWKNNRFHYDNVSLSE